MRRSDPEEPAGDRDDGAVNLPQPVVVRAEHGHPRAVRLKGEWRAVEQVLDRWRVDTHWWQKLPIRRMWFRVLLRGGRDLCLFLDLHTGAWYRQHWQAPVRPEGPFGALTDRRPAAPRATAAEELEAALFGAAAAARRGDPGAGLARLQGKLEHYRRTGDPAAQPWEEAVREFEQRWFGG